MAEEKKQKQTNDILDKKTVDKTGIVKLEQKTFNELPPVLKNSDEEKLDRSVKESASEVKEKKVVKKRKKKIQKRVAVGTDHIKATYNNTIVTLTDQNGDVISWASAGTAGFKGPKKSTPYAAQIIAKIAIEKAKQFGLAEVNVLVNGVGTGRESAIRALNANGLVVTSIKDITPIPHNGCRPAKPRRV